MKVSIPKPLIPFLFDGVGAIVEVVAKNGKTVTLCLQQNVRITVGLEGGKPKKYSKVFFDAEGNSLPYPVNKN
jgi:hypothetical protein